MHGRTMMLAVFVATRREIRLRGLGKCGHNQQVAEEHSEKDCDAVPHNLQCSAKNLVGRKLIDGVCNTGLQP